MSVYKFEVSCTHCGYNQTRNWSRDRAGLKGKIKCHQCDKQFIVTAPMSPEINSNTQINDNTNRGKGAYLLVLGNEYIEDRRYVINDLQVTIGRKNSTKFPDIALDTSDLEISRLHCDLYRYADGEYYYYTIMQRERTNGTYINSKKLRRKTEIILETGDVIKLGNVSLKFLLTNS